MRFLRTLAGVAGATLAGLAALRVLTDRRMDALAVRLATNSEQPPPFDETHLDGLPAVAQRYLRHAVTLGTPLAPAVRLEMTGTMTPTPGASPVRLTATETLAPRQGFVWTATARMNGLPVRVRDHYDRGEGAVRVTALGIVPQPVGRGDAADIARSSLGRLVGEAVWCPTALVHPSVAWEGVDDERVRYTLHVDGEPVSVTLRVGPEGALREVTMRRWGDVDGPPARPLPYGFRVDAEGTFGGVTIPTRITGGWHYGTPRFDAGAAASFAVEYADFSTAR